MFVSQGPQAVETEQGARRGAGAEDSAEERALEGVCGGAGGVVGGLVIRIPRYLTLVGTLRILCG